MLPLPLAPSRLGAGLDLRRRSAAGSQPDRASGRDGRQGGRAPFSAGGLRRARLITAGPDWTYGFGGENCTGSNEFPGHDHGRERHLLGNNELRRLLKDPASPGG